MILYLGLLTCLAIYISQSVSVHIRNRFQKKCLSFAPEAHVFNSTRQVLEYVPAGKNLTFPHNDPTCMRPGQLVATDLCRVALSVPTSNRSSITFEIWLPQKWSGRLLGTGNGGLDGCWYYLNALTEHNPTFAADTSS